MIAIEAESEEALAALQRLAAGVTPAKMKAPLMKIGQELVESTRERFQTRTAPDGTPWAKNAPATEKRKGKNTPLVDTGIFSRDFHYQVDEGNLFVGTNYMHELIKSGGENIGLAVHQFGSLNGRIPARPFLGVSPADEEMIESEVSDYLRSLIPA
jgi:phage virion morphogenesis protein